MTASEDEKKPVEGEQGFKSIIVDDEGLGLLVSKPRFFSYLKSAWLKRHFSIAYARARALSTGRDRYLGSLWIVLDPVFQVAIYGLIFGLILNVSRGIDNFIGFLIIGVVYFGFFQKGINAGSGLIQSSRSLISSFYFPKVLLVVAEIVRAVINNFIPAILAIVFAVFFQLDQPLHWTIIFVIPLFFLIHFFIFGAELIIARMTAFIPDLKSLVSLFMRGMFFLSGVFFTISRFEASPVITTLVELNPVYQFLMAVRNCVLIGDIPTLEVWAYLTAWSFGLILFGLVFFWTAEERYAGVR